ncbi:Rieske (2Fe-2S) protein [Microbacterium sp. zg.B48]|uniref:Rieske (2Fe-2S) protein n=1 Tax=Microbacterium sp. zg.B48 TaxID=2969408 RepID=UPI00214B17BC|nr:Rieske (2Fe-2S) protein [Microbacterium sp. zg.B48]MCR2764343.1 Rieske (2Fe-2S) protein [Microbacterium sp. zg.B48]
MTLERPPATRRRDGKYIVARTKDIPEGSRIIVEVDGKEIGIFRVDGQFHAILNYCPHRGGELCKGDVLGLVESSRPGDVRLDETKKFIVCPWHGWEFDIKTGESWYDPAVNTDPNRYPPARAFQVGVESGGRVAEEIEAAEAVAVETEGGYVDAVNHRVAGPYTAQVMPLEIDDEFVVLSFRRAR